MSERDERIAELKERHDRFHAWFPYVAEENIDVILAFIHEYNDGAPSEYKKDDLCVNSYMLGYRTAIREAKTFLDNQGSRI